MPRLEDGELLTSASKFKKRRAWIMPDDSESATKTTGLNPLSMGGQRIEEPLITTRVEHDSNMSVTRVEHDYNMSVTRVEQEISLPNAAKRKSKTRLEHEYNKTVTRLEHESNKTEAAFELRNFFAFIKSQNASIINYEDDSRSLILSLSDAQKRIFWHIAMECINRNEPHTGPIEIKGFFEKLAISTPVVRTTLNRLVDKRMLQREKGKLGKNGFAIISIPKKMLDDARAIIADFKANI